MEGLENATVTAIDELATLYARPIERVLAKEIDHVDAVGRAFIGLTISCPGDREQPRARLLAQRRQARLRPGRG
jgi:hypothetical protein